MDALENMPEWYKEVMSVLKSGKKCVSPEKRIIIDFLKTKIKELEEN